MAKNRDKSKLSPGPWRLSDDDYVIRRSVKDANGYDICVIDSWTPKPDARVIAAAREMYSLCHALSFAGAPMDSAFGGLIAQAQLIIKKIEAQNAADKA